MEDTRPHDRTIPAFSVSTMRGFLPRQEPITELPSEFSAVDTLLNRMPVKTLSGAPGLLAQFTFGDTVLKELPDLTGRKVSGRPYRYECTLSRLLLSCFCISA